MIVVADPHTLVHSRRWAAWLAWVEKAGAVPGDRGWRMPSKPSRYRDASSDESDEDAHGRRIRRRGDDESEDSDDDRSRVAGEAKRRAAARKEQRRKERAERATARAAERAAAGEEAGEEEQSEGQLAEEAKWRELLLQQAADADSEYQKAFAAQVERERRAAEAKARGELTEDEKAAAEAAAAAARAEEEEAQKQGTVPFAFVALPPTPYSPAEDAGLLAGDAILRFGGALKLEDVPAQIRHRSGLESALRPWLRTAPHRPPWTI